MWILGRRFPSPTWVSPSNYLSNLSKVSHVDDFVAANSPQRAVMFNKDQQDLCLLLDCLKIKFLKNQWFTQISTHAFGAEEFH
jgi:hypothetical protein